MKSMITALLLGLCVALTACFANVTDDHSEHVQQSFQSVGESRCFEGAAPGARPEQVYVDAMTCGEFGAGFSNPPDHYVVKATKQKADTEERAPDDRAYEDCVDLSRNGMLIMQARQGGLEKARLISASEDPGFHQAVHAVYSVPREATKRRQDEVANRFALDLLAECLQQRG